jgi:hypothetical protein
MVQTSNSAEQMPLLVIHSEAEAYQLLEQALSGRVPPFGEVRFEGWPKLEIHLRGKDFNSSLTPPVMKGLLAFQKGIYQSYAAAKYEDPSKRLSDEEKRALEIVVKVEPGSSDLKVDFQELAAELIKQVGGKMDSQTILIVVLTFLVLYFGSTTLKSYLDDRKELRLREVSDETQRRTLEALEFNSAQETDRIRILAEAIGSRPQLQNVAAIAHDARTELVKGIGEADEATISGVSLTGKAAVTLVKNARRQSEEIRLDGLYRLVRLDWSDPAHARVKVWNLNTGLELDATLQDSMTGAYRRILQEAEWSRKPVRLQINARRTGGDQYSAATILSVEAAELNSASS